MMYGSWDIKNKGQSFLWFCHFLPFDPPNNPKNQNFEEIKQIAGDIIILHLCTTNDSTWDIKHDRIFCHFGLFFALLPLQQHKKSKFWKNEKKSWKYCHFTHEYHKWSTINENHMMYDSWDIECDRQKFFSFGPFFALYLFWCNRLWCNKGSSEKVFYWTSQKLPSHWSKITLEEVRLPSL